MANDLFFRELEKFIPRPGTAAVYSKIISIAYNERTKDARSDVRSFQQKIMTLNEDIASARRKFMKDKIDEQDYRSFKQECEKRSSD